MENLKDKLCRNEDGMQSLIQKLDLQSFRTDSQMGEVVEEEAKNKKKKLTDSIKRVVNELNPKDYKLTRAQLKETLKDVKIDGLPQRFLVKLIGMRSCFGLWGSSNTRPLVDEMVESLKNLDKREDLPLLNVKIDLDGIKFMIHKHNRSSLPVPLNGLVPLKFISYAVQDHRYAKVFAFILVREMSSREKVMECYSFLTDSIITCRKMALSTAQAFRILEESLKGVPKDRIFQVDLGGDDGAGEEENTEI